MAIWNILGTFGIIYDHFVQVVFVWYLFPALVPCTKKNLEALVEADCSTAILAAKFPEKNINSFEQNSNKFEHNERAQSVLFAQFR
jgi:hypothetical protein